MTLLALPLAILLALSLAALIERWVPLYAIQPLAWQPLLTTALAVLGFAVAGGLLPAWRIRRVDPASVFRG